MQYGKFHTLVSLIARYMAINKRRVLMKIFLSSHLPYCPLIKMSHSRKNQHRINSIHKIALRLFYEDFHHLKFQELPAKICKWITSIDRMAV